MKTEHTLTIRARRNRITVDGLCSCLKWRVINRPRGDVREQHAEHVRTAVQHG